CGIGRRLHRGPEFDTAVFLAVGIVPDEIAGRAEPIACGRAVEQRIDEFEHGLSRPARNFWPLGGKGEPCLFDSLAAIGEMASERFRVRSLEAEDRLLLVADREQGPRSCTFTCAAAGEEFLGELVYDLPLLGARVLRLVDENMVETAIELVENPGGGIGA